VQVVKANIAGKPLEQARQAKIGGAESLLDIYKRALGMLPGRRRNGSGRGIATPTKQGRC